MALALSQGAQTVYFYKAPASSTYTATNSTLTKSGSGSSPTPTIAGSAVDRYILKIEITKSGALGAGRFRYSLDNGNKWHGDFLLPSGGTFAITLPYATGLTLTFGAGTYETSDSFVSYHYPAAVDVSVASTIVTNIVNDQRSFRHIHIVGSAQNAASDLLAIGTDLVTIANLWTSATDTELPAGYKFAQIHLDSPSPRFSIDHTSSTIANFKTAKATIVENVRLHIGVGEIRIACPLTGLLQYRNASWSYVEDFYAKTTDISEDPGWVARGPVSVLAVTMNDALNGSDSLYGYGFHTMRSVPTKGKGNFWRSGGVSLGASASDFYYITTSLVADLTAEVATNRAVDELNKKVLTNPDGTLSIISAKEIEKTIKRDLGVLVIAPGYAQGIDVIVDRSNNIKTTKTIKIDLTIETYGYILNVTLNVKINGGV